MNKSVAVLIGAGADLPATINDVNSISEVFTIAGNYDVFTLVDDKATKKGIVELFESISIDFNYTNFVFYFSGHGGCDERDFGNSNKHFICPFDYDNGNQNETALYSAELCKLITKVKSLNNIIFLDCCHAGGMFKNGQSNFRKAASGIIQALSNLKNAKIIFSSSHDNEVSYLEDDLMNSVFTNCLIDALTNNKFAQHGILEVISNVMREVQTRTIQKAYGVQRPFLNKIENLSESMILLDFTKKPMNLLARDSEAKSLELEGLRKVELVYIEKLSYLLLCRINEPPGEHQFSIQRSIERNENELSEIRLKIKNLLQGE